MTRAEYFHLCMAFVVSTLVVVAVIWRVNVLHDVPADLEMPTLPAPAIESE